MHAHRSSAPSGAERTAASATNPFPFSTPQMSDGMMRSVAALLAASAQMGVAPSVRADPVFTISAQSDLRFRGRSLSQGQPVATVGVEVKFDERFYFGGGATGTIGGNDKTGLLLGQAYLGYASRLSPDVSFDIGVVATRYSSLYSGLRADAQVEAYAGIARGAVSAYVRFTPTYLGRPVPAAYATATVTKEIAPKWRLNGSAGLLVQTGGATALGGRRSRYDVGLGISREAGRATLSLDWTLGGPGDSYYSGPWRGRSAFTIGISGAF